MLLLLLVVVVADGGVGDALREGGRLEDVFCVEELIGTNGDAVAMVVGETSSSPIT